MSLDKNAEMLSDFGLTRNQAKVYIAVAQLGMASVSQVSKVSKVRREDVYRTLPKLEKMGLLEKVLSTPAKVRAIPVEEALHVLVEREQEIANKRLSALMTKKDTFLKHYKPSRIKTTEEVHFGLILHREGIMGKELSMVKNAKSAINVVTSREKFFQIFSNYDEALKKAINRGIQVRMILNVTEHDDSILRTLKEYESARTPVELKYTDQRSTHCMIVDYKEALVATSTDPTLRETAHLWTDDSSLVGLLQKNFEGLWHASVELRTIETEGVTEKLIHILEDLRPTNHAIVLYESLEAKYNVLFNYLKLGLENGEAGVYVTSEENPRQIREVMEKFGIHVEKYEKTGALGIYRYEDIYFVGEEFDLATTMKSWSEFYNRALRNGFKGLRVAGETTWFFKRKLIPELIEYERLLHTTMVIPMIAICAYNTNMVIEASNPMDLYNELLKAHGTVLFSGLNKEMGKIEIRQA